MAFRIFRYVADDGKPRLAAVDHDPDTCADCKHKSDALLEYKDVSFVGSLDELVQYLKEDLEREGYAELSDIPGEVASAITEEEGEGVAIRVLFKLIQRRGGLV